MASEGLFRWIFKVRKKQDVKWRKRIRWQTFERSGCPQSKGLKKTKKSNIKEQDKEGTKTAADRDRENKACGKEPEMKNIHSVPHKKELYTNNSTKSPSAAQGYTVQSKRVKGLSS